MFKRSKYYVVGDGSRVSGNTKVTTDDCFEDDESLKKRNRGEDRILTKRNFSEYLGMVIAPKFFRTLDIIVDIASVAGVFMLLYNGLSHLLNLNEND